MSARIHYDDSLWPLLTLRLVGTLSDAEMEEYRAQAGAFLARGEKYVTISDLSQLGMMSARQRQRQAAWLQENEAAHRERVLGNATIIHSAPLRLAMSLIIPFKPLPFPYVVVADMGSALKYALRRLEESGLGGEAERIRRLLEHRGIRIT